MWFRRMLTRRHLVATCIALLLLGVMVYQDGAVARKANGQSPEKWVDEIERVFIRSEECKQCHDRHYEEWKGAREQTPTSRPSAVWTLPCCTARHWSRRCFEPCSVYGCRR